MAPSGVPTGSHTGDSTAKRPRQAEPRAVPGPVQAPQECPLQEGSPGAQCISRENHKRGSLNGGVLIRRWTRNFRNNCNNSSPKSPVECLIRRPSFRKPPSGSSRIPIYGAADTGASRPAGPGRAARRRPPPEQSRPTRPGCSHRPGQAV